MNSLRGSYLRDSNENIEGGRFFENIFCQFLFKFGTNFDFQFTMDLVTWIYTPTVTTNSTGSGSIFLPAYITVYARYPIV